MDRRYQVLTYGPGPAGQRDAGGFDDRAEAEKTARMAVRRDGCHLAQVMRNGDLCVVALWDSDEVEHANS